MTALQDMFCREGPDPSYRDNLTVFSGEVYPVLARWKNDWLMISINQPEITRSKCCWVGGEWSLNIPLEQVRLITTIPDRFTCTLP
jgi:hypothetical protein